MTNKRLPGFTLIETVVAIGVFGIFFAAIALILQQVLQNVGIARSRSVALSLAQEKMETIKTMPYTAVGTLGGIPSGSIAQTEVQVINDQPFTITTSILYIDDPYDGVAPTDPIPADYKRIRIQVTWEGVYPSRVPETLVSNMVPHGIESNPGGGTLYLQVINAQGFPVPSASVTVTNTIVNPPINMTTLSTAQGNVTIPAAPACISCYNVSVTKSGYSTDRTYTTAQVANPILPPSTVIAGEVTQMTFSIDRFGSLSITSVGSRESGYPPLVNVIFTLRGSKIIGYDTSDNPVFKYAYQTNTGGGTVGIPNLEWDNYIVDLSSSNYTLAGSIPLLPYQIQPASASSMTIMGQPKFNDSLLVIVKDQLGNLQANAVATLSSTIPIFTSTKTTAATGAADFGQAFFNNIAAATYDLAVSLAPYQLATSSVTVTTNQQTIVVLSP